MMTTTTIHKKRYLTAFFGLGLVARVLAQGETPAGGQTPAQAALQNIQAIIDKLPQIKTKKICVKIHIDGDDIRAITNLADEIGSLMNGRGSGGQNLINTIMQAGEDDNQVAHAAQVFVQGLKNNVTLSDPGLGGAPTDDKKIIVPVILDITYDWNALMDYGMQRGEQELLARTQPRRWQPIRNMVRRGIRRNFYRGGKVWDIVAQHVRQFICYYLGNFRHSLQEFASRFGMGKDQISLEAADQVYQGSVNIWTSDGKEWKKEWSITTAQLRSLARRAKDMDLEKVAEEVEKIIKQIKESREKARELEAQAATGSGQAATPGAGAGTDPGAAAPTGTTPDPGTTAPGASTGSGTSDSSGNAS